MTTPIPSAALLGNKRLLLVKSTASAVEAELLKATVSKTIVVPAYTRKDGVVVPAHTKVVHYDPSKDVADVLSGKGSHSQKQAHKKLSKLGHWESLEDSHKLAHILSSATNIQQKASASAAVSGWKASMLAGKKPTASQQAAFDALPADKQAALQAEVGKPVTAPVAAPVTEPVAAAPAYQPVPSALGGLGNEGPVIHVDAPDYAAVEKALGLEPGSLEGEDSTTYTIKNAAGQTFSVYKHGGGLSVRTSGANKDTSSALALADHLALIGKPAEASPAAVPLVTGADGQPKVFYHGGTGSVDSADLKPLTFFTSDKETALSYVGNNSEDEKLHAVHLAIGKVATPDDVKAAANKVGLTGDDVGVDEEYHAGYEYLSPHLNPHVEKVLAELKKQGFDGAHFPTDFKLSGELMPGGSWVVFGKGQVVPASGDHGLQGVGSWAHLSQYKSQHPMFITAQAKAWLADNPGKGAELSSTLVDLGHLDIAKKLGVYTPPSWASPQEKAAAAGPKEGDTKPAADGGTLVLKDGHWVKQGGEAPKAKQPASLAMPAFEEGKEKAGVKAHYEKVGQKVLDLASAGDAAGLEKLKADGLKPNSKGKVGNTWKGKTQNSKLLLALHDQALAHTKGNTTADQPAQAVSAEPVPAPAAPAAEASPIAASKLTQIPWDAQLLPDANSNAKSHNGQVAKIKAMAEAGDVAGLQAYVDAKAGAKQTYAKKQHLLAATALAALKEDGAPAAPEANPLAGVSAAEAIAKNPHMPQLKLKELWIDANADKVGAQAEWAMAVNPAPAKPARLAESQKKMIDDIATWPDAKYHLANIVGGGNPAAAAYAQQLLDAKKATVAVDKPKPPTGIEEHSEAGAYLADAAYGLEHKDLPTLQDVITALQGDMPAPGSDADKVLQFAKNAYKHVAGAAPATSKPADPTVAELAPMMEAVNSAGSAEGAKKAALRYLNAFPDSQLAINQVHDALVNAGHAAMAAAFAKDGKSGLEAFKPAAPAGPSKVTAELFHNTSEGHNKFWAVSVNGNVVKTTYGKIGSKGQTTEKVFGSKAEAQSHATTLMLQKHKGGYVPAGKTEHEYAAPAAEQGPKDGDTKQGADGMLVFTDGRWHKLSEKAKAAIDSLSLDDLKEFADTPGMPVAQNAYIKAKLAGAEPMDSWQQTGGEESDAWAFTEKDPSFSGVNTLMADMDGLSVYIAYEPESATFEVGQIHPGADEPEADHFSDPKKALDYLASMYGASVEMPSLGQVEKLTGKVSGATYSPKVPTPDNYVPSSGTGYEAMDGWKQTGPQGGSNPGGRFRDEFGVEWYCKFPADEDIAKSEVLAAKLYAALGVSGQDCKLVTKGGKVGIASRWIDVKKGTAAQLAKLDGTASGFAADAWLANHDVVGLAFDNLQIGPDGKAHRVDAGGSLQYRAQGGKKAFGPTVSEIDSLRDPAINSKSAAVFGKMTEADITASVAKVLALPDSAITNLVNQYGPGSDADKLALAQTLIARKADLAKKYPKAAKAPKKRLDPTNLPVDAAMLPKPHDFENWNGPGQGLSSKAHVNKANAAIEYQILGVAQMGNLPKLQAFEYAQIDKETGQPNGKMLPIANHPSKHVVQYHADLVTMLDEMANPPEPLKVFQETDISTLEQLSASLPPKKFGTTVDSVKSNEKLGFWVVLGVAPGAVNLAPKKFMAYSQAAIAAGYEKYKQGTSLAKHFIKSVQASGSYNDLFRNGKKTDHSGNLLSDVAKAALQHATTQPEGTSLYRWQKMTDAMVQKIMAAPEGTVFQATGPMCTSYDPTATKHFGTHRVTVRYAKGAKAVESFGSNGYQSEKEVTTLPNSRFVILKRNMVPDVEHGNPHKTRLELEVLMLPPDLGL